MSRGERRGRRLASRPAPGKSVAGPGAVGGATDEADETDETGGLDDSMLEWKQADGSKG